MYYKTGIQRNIEKEFLASDKVVSFTGTVVSDGVTPDEEGKKIVHKGSLIAASGKLVTVTSSGTFSETPKGILMDSLDVTYGPQPGALLVEGYVIGARLNLGVDYTTSIGTAIHAVLPEIKFVNDEPESESDISSSGTSGTSNEDEGGTE